MTLSLFWWLKQALSMDYNTVYVGARMWFQPTHLCSLQELCWSWAAAGRWGLCRTRPAAPRPSRSGGASGRRAGRSSRRPPGSAPLCRGRTERAAATSSPLRCCWPPTCPPVHNIHTHHTHCQANIKPQNLTSFLKMKKNILLQLKAQKITQPLHTKYLFLYKSTSWNKAVWHNLLIWRNYFLIKKILNALADSSLLAEIKKENSYFFFTTQ